MIQRIQSIFLFLASFVAGGLLTDPAQLITVGTGGVVSKIGGETVLADGVFHSTDHILLLAMVGINVILVLVALFMFNNRPLQLTLSRISIAITILFLVLSGILFYQAFQQVPVGTELTVEFGVLLPIIEIILLVLAIRFIGKDNKLVRSMDRLR